MKFFPIKTNDSSITLYNIHFEDVYHSKVGAYTEAMYKYVIPSGILEFVKHSSSVRILDVCYGLGYNTRAAVNEILKINPECEIFVSALEIDPVVLAYSAIIGNECFNDQVNYVFFITLSKLINIEEFINKDIEETYDLLPEIENLVPGEYDLVSCQELLAKLHNIYYRSFCKPKIQVKFHINDAKEEILKQVQDDVCPYDFIFHDPFTPSKAPILWTVEFFNSLNNLLSDDGNLTTYSNAAPVRAAMIETGFYIGRTEPVGKKTPGTIAYKNPDLIKNELTVKEQGILRTKAGIPYKDAPTNEQILINREAKKLSSSRISSSRFLKSMNKSC